MREKQPKKMRRRMKKINRKRMIGRKIKLGGMKKKKGLKLNYLKKWWMKQMNLEMWTKKIK